MISLSSPIKGTKLKKNILANLKLYRIKIYQNMFLPWTFSSENLQTMPRLLWMQSELPCWYWLSDSAVALANTRIKQMLQTLQTIPKCLRQSTPVSTNVYNYTIWSPSVPHLVRASAMPSLTSPCRLLCCSTQCTIRYYQGINHDAFQVCIKHRHTSARPFAHSLLREYRAYLRQSKETRQDPNGHWVSNFVLEISCRVQRFVKACEVYVQIILVNLCLMMLWNLLIWCEQWQPQR